MISHEELEEFICQFPVYQYAFFKPEEIDFSFRVRWICEKNVSAITPHGRVPCRRHSGRMQKTLS